MTQALSLHQQEDYGLIMMKTRKASRLKVEGQKDTGDDRHDRQRTPRLQQEECKSGWGLGSTSGLEGTRPIDHLYMILSFFRFAFVFCICRWSGYAW